MEAILYEAVKNDNEEEVRQLLAEHPAINVNWNGNTVLDTALHWACNRGHEKITSMLLAHPAIDINQRNRNGSTPFLVACINGSTGCARLLLKEAKLENLNWRSLFGDTPLQRIAQGGLLDVAKWWIASGKELDLSEHTNTGKAEVVSLLERFGDHPEDTRHEVRVELGWYDGVAAEIFAQIIFLCDGLLDLEGEKASKAARFFKIVRQLPMELQMMMSYRVMGSLATCIPQKERELAFRSLTRLLSPRPS